MSKLLVNGCSYTKNWSSTLPEFGTKLGFDETVNIGKSGSSNHRIFRSTLNYILNNPVDFIILSLTFWDRQEAPWGIDGDNLWIDYSINGVMLESDQLAYPRDSYSSYIKSRYKHDIGPAYIDKFISDIIVFSGFLDHLGIRYLIFSAPGEHLKFDPIKISYLDKNPRIIDLSNWSSNQYMYENGGQSQETGNPSYLHYDIKSYKLLNNFLYDYIIKHQL